MKLDEVILNIINNEIAAINTTMECEVITDSPLTIKPVKSKLYTDESLDYDLIVTARKLKEWALIDGVPVQFEYPLTVGNRVLVAFGKHDLTNAVILGVIE
jgi:hypothetical protein